MEMNTRVLRALCAAVVATVLAPLGWAATPVAVWDGDFSELTKDSLTISLNGNTRAEDNAYLQVSSGATGGILVDDTTSGGLNTYTMILRCSDLNLEASSAQVLFTSKSGTDTNTDKVGVCLPANNGACCGIWQNGYWGNNATKASIPTGYTTLIYNHQQANGTYAYAVTSNGVTQIYGVQGLRASNDSYDGIAIGGLRGTRSGNTALDLAADLKVTGIAIFRSTLTTVEMQTYKFPSDQSEGGVVARIGNAEYETLAAAISAVPDGSAIELVANVTESEAIELTKNITLTCAKEAIVTTVIGGEGTITKTGAGTLTLAGANTFTGDVTVSAGVLKRGSNAAFGVAANNVIVESGATLDMNNVGGTGYPITIAGAGAEGRPYALTSTGSLAGFASITLSADATIGTTGSCAINYGGGSICLAGHKLSMVCGSGITGTNMNFEEGTFEIVSGRYTANQWNNNGANTTLVICEGATYASSVDGDTRCGFKHIVNNGTIAMNATYTARASASYMGAGAVNNLGLADGATIKLASVGGITVSGRFVQDGALVIDLSAVELGETTEVTVMTAPEATAYKLTQVSVTGAEGNWAVSAAAGVLKVIKASTVATVDGEEYTSVAEAFAAANGKTVNVLYTTTEAIVVTGDVTVSCAEGVVLGGAITGTGSITIPEGTTLTYSGTAVIGPTVMGEGVLCLAEISGNAIPSVTGLTDAANWTGTVWLKNLTGKTNMNFANLGNAESTIKMSGVRGWMAKAQTIVATVELANEGYAYGLNIHDGSSGDANVSTFEKLAGDGKLLADGGSTAGFLIKEWSEFTGSVEASDKTLTFGTEKKAGLNKIIVAEGTTVTVAEGATWSANGGIQVDGTLVVAGTTTYDNFTPLAATHGTLASPVMGAGEVVYDGALPTDAAAAMYTNTVWTGSVTIRNFGELDSRTGISNSGHVRACFPGKAEVESWQNANSRITFKGVKAWTPNNVSYDINLVLEDQLGENDDVIYAWHNDSGGSTSTTTFAKLSGSGTLYDNAACTHILKFTDVSSFTGAVKIQGKRVCFGASTTSPNSGGVQMSSVLPTTGKAWIVPGGVTIEDGSTLVYAGGPLTLADDNTLAFNAGTITVGVAEDVETFEDWSKVLSWSAKPSDVTFEKAEGVSEKVVVVVKGSGLYLTLIKPFVISIQ